MRTSTRYTLVAVMLTVLLAGSAFAQSSVRRSTNSGSTGNSSSTTTQQQVRRGTTTTSSEKKESTAVQNQNTRTTNQNTRSTATQNTRTNNQNGSSVRRSTGSTDTRSTATTTEQTTRSTSTTDQNTRTSSSTRTTVAGSQSATRTGSSDQSTRTTAGRTTTEQTAHQTTDQTTRNQTSTNVTRRGLSSVSTGSTGSSSQTKNNDKVAASDYRVNNNNVERISPRERGYQSYNTPKSFYSHDSHYYGWKVHSMPPRPKRVRYYGIDYYLHNDVYYRIYGSSYIVCRPPVGVVITKTVKTPFGRVTFSYYTNTYRSYNGWDSYSRYIDEQNRIIAQNNAYIAAQNRAIAMNLNHAQSSYELAYKLGLAQSYAYANWDYYYDDGVFYIINRNGRYEVIVPPAGALVDELPDDYETIYLGGMELYRVDDTIYRTVLVSGRPYLEVLGQMYGTLASKYSIYR